MKYAKIKRLLRKNLTIKKNVTPFIISLLPPTSPITSPTPPPFYYHPSSYFPLQFHSSSTIFPFFTSFSYFPSSTHPNFLLPYYPYLPRHPSTFPPLTFPHCHSLNSPFSPLTSLLPVHFFEPLPSFSYSPFPTTPPFSLFHLTSSPFISPYLPYSPPLTSSAPSIYFFFSPSPTYPRFPTTPPLSVLSQLHITSNSILSVPLLLLFPLTTIPFT